MRTCIAVVLAACVVSAARPATGAEAPAKTQAAQALEARVDLDFEKTSLDNVLAYIDEVRRDLTIVIDPAVAEAGINLGTRVIDLRVKQVAVGRVLDLVLGDELAYVPRETDVLITTRRVAQRRLVTRTYPVDGLLRALRREDQGPLTGPGDAAGNLVDLVTVVVPPTALARVAGWTHWGGGPGTIAVQGQRLVVSQTQAGHDVIAAFLPVLEKAMQAADRQRARTDVARQQPVLFLNEPGPRMKETEKWLRERMDMDFERTSLATVLNYISEVQRGLNIVLSPSIQASGIDPSATLVDLKAASMPVGRVLERICGPELACTVGPGYVLVLPRDDLPLTLRVYRADAIRPDRPGAGVLDGFRQAFETVVGDLRSEGGPPAADRVAAWTRDGGPAFAGMFGNALIVTQTEAGHACALKALERLQGPPRR